MNEQLDLEAIYRQERQRWLQEVAPRKSLRDLIADSVPYWIILVALVLYGLSAPHTSAVFDRLTAGWGWIAPIGVEFGLLYAAFRRRLSKHAGEAISWTLWMLELLLFITAMLVNGAGAFTSVVNSMQLNALSFAQIVERFGDLPATSQAALIMAALSAFIIPIGALVTGEGLATLVLERRGGDNFQEVRWREVEFRTIYRAVYVRYLHHGLPDRDAKARAFAEVKGYLTESATSGVRLLSAQSVQAVQPGQREQVNSEQGNGVKSQVRTYLTANPDAVQLSVNQLMTALHAQGVQAGRTTVAEILREARKRD